jgi:3,4-dihydroxy 2-butanone 4-phosphate synthase/GTP cyclohydrolase II
VHVALVRGDVAGQRDVPVHVQRECLAAGVFASRACGCSRRLERALFMITATGAGVVLYLRGEYGALGAHAPLGVEDFAIAVRMLEDRGVRSVRVLEDDAAGWLEAAGMPARQAAREPAA